MQGLRVPVRWSILRCSNAFCRRQNYFNMVGIQRSGVSQRIQKSTYSDFSMLPDLSQFITEEEMNNERNSRPPRPDLNKTVTKFLRMRFPKRYDITRCINLFRPNRILWKFVRRVLSSGAPDTASLDDVLQFLDAIFKSRKGAKYHPRQGSVSKGHILLNCIIAAGITQGEFKSTLRGIDRMSSLGIDLNMASLYIWCLTFVTRYQHRNRQPLTEDEKEFVSDMIGRLHSFLLKHPPSEKEVEVIRNLAIFDHISHPPENRLDASYPPRLFSWNLLSNLCSVASLTTEPVMRQMLDIILWSGFPLSLVHTEAFCFFYVKMGQFDKWRSLILEHPKLEIFCPEGAQSSKIQLISEKIAKQISSWRPSHGRSSRGIEALSVLLARFPQHARLLVPSMKEVICYMTFIGDRSSAESAFQEMRSMVTEPWHVNHLHAAGFCILMLLRRLKDEKSANDFSQVLAELIPDASSPPIETKQILCRERLLVASKSGSLDAIQSALTLTQSIFSSEDDPKYLRYVLNPVIMDHISIAIMRAGRAVEADQLARLRAPATDGSLPDELDFTYSLPLLRAMTLESVRQASSATDVLYKSLGSHSTTPIDVAMLSYQAKTKNYNAMAEMVNHLRNSAANDETTAQVTATILMAEATETGNFERLFLIFDDLASRFQPNAHVRSAFLEKLMKRSEMREICLLFYWAWIEPVLAEYGDAQLYNSSIYLFSRLRNPLEALRLFQEARSNGIVLDESAFIRIFNLFSEVGDLPTLLQLVLELSSDSNFEMNSRVFDILLKALKYTRDYPNRLKACEGFVRADLSNIIQLDSTASSFRSRLIEKIEQERPQFLSPSRFDPDQWMGAFTQPSNNIFYNLDPERRDMIAWDMTRMFKAEFQVRLTSQSISLLAEFVSTPQQLLDFVAHDIILESAMPGSTLNLTLKFANQIFSRLRSLIPHSVDHDLATEIREEIKVVTPRGGWQQDKNETLSDDYSRRLIQLLRLWAKRWQDALDSAKNTELR